MIFRIGDQVFPDFAHRTSGLSADLFSSTAKRVLKNSHKPLLQEPAPHRTGHQEMKVGTKCLRRQFMSNADLIACGVFNRKLKQGNSAKKKKGISFSAYAFINKKKINYFAGMSKILGSTALFISTFFTTIVN
jgi:hypothetical protein